MLGLAWFLLLLLLVNPVDPPGPMLTPSLVVGSALTRLLSSVVFFTCSATDSSGLTRFTQLKWIQSVSQSLLNYCRCARRVGIKKTHTYEYDLQWINLSLVLTNLSFQFVLYKKDRSLFWNFVWWKCAWHRSFLDLSFFWFKRGISIPW